MQELKIDVELKDLLPKLDEEKEKLLEEDILKNGCISPIILWNGYIVDGHHRYKICKRNNLEFKTKEMQFENKQEAMIWAWTTQKARRNIDDGTLFKIAKVFKPYYEKKAKENQRTSTGGVKPQLCMKSDKAEKVDTIKELANMAGTGRDTMNKVIQVQKHAPEPIQKAVENNVVSINKGYEMTKKIKELPEENREEEAFALLNNAIEEKLKKANMEDDRKARNAKKINNAVYDAIIIEVNEENIECWLENKNLEDIEHQEKNIDEAIRNFKTIKEMIQKYKGVRRIK